MRRVVPLAFLASLALPATPVIGQASTAAGVTVIHASGTTGVVLDVPSLAHVGFCGSECEGDILLDPKGASFVFVAFGRRQADCPPDPAEPWFLTCLWWGLVWASEAPTPGFVWFPDPDGILGLTEIYILTDSPVTLEVHFRGLPGRTEIEATQPIRARFERLPSFCSAGAACEHLSYGGEAKNVGPAGYTAAYAYSRAPMGVVHTPIGWVPNAYLGGTVTCLYPDPSFAPNASPDPEEHPTGCGHKDRPTTIAVNGVNLLLSSPLGGAELRINYGASGDAYVGYMIDNLTAVGEGQWGAYGVWISPGID